MGRPVDNKSFVDLPGVQEYATVKGIRLVAVELPDDEDEEAGQPVQLEEDAESQTLRVTKVPLSDEQRAGLTVKNDARIPPAVVESQEEQSPAEKIQALVDHWQKRMGLSEWDLDWEFCSKHEIGGDTYADISFDIYHFQATLRLLEDQPEEQWEWLVVHELLHLVLCPLQCFAEKVMAAHDTRESRIFDEFWLDHIEPVINKLAAILLGKRRPKLQ
jgi:hypothetical protein